VSTVVVIILLFCVAVPIGQAIAKRIAAEADKPRIAGDDHAEERLGTLERQVRYLAEQVQGLQENQEFLERLLEGRSASDEPAQIEEKRT
jgi:hypothetical protein